MEKLWVIESGQKRKAEKYNCEHCKKEFLRRTCKKAKKYCSTECRKLKGKVKLICSYCGKVIFKNISKLKNSKHGFYFCDKRCKDKAQSLAGNCPAIRPSHYGTSNGREVYKNLIKKSDNAICVGCGEVKKYLLDVHHKDGDKSNNKRKNLEIVCCKCHRKRHLKKGSIGWIYDPHVLTPRDVLFSLLGT